MEDDEDDEDDELDPELDRPEATAESEPVAAPGAEEAAPEDTNYQPAALDVPEKDNMFAQFAQPAAAEENMFSQFAPPKVNRAAKGNFGGEPPAPPPDDNMFSQFAKEKPLPESSQTGTIARGLAEGLVPAGGGSLISMVVGSAIAGGLSRGNPGAMRMGAKIGGIASGFIAGTAAGIGLSALEEKILDAMGIRAGEGWFSAAQKEADTLEWPRTREYSEAIPALIGMNPAAGASSVGKFLGQRAGGAVAGAGIGGALSAAQEYAETGKVTSDKTLRGVEVGGVLGALGGVKENPLGAKVLQGGERLGRGRPGAAPAGAAPTEPEPGPPPKPGGRPLEGEILPPEDNIDNLSPKQAAAYEEVKFAASQRDKYQPGDQFYEFWDTAVREANDRVQGTGDKGDPANIYDASRGPQGKEHDFTYQDADRANQSPSVSKGTSLVQNRPPQNPETGNPVGASTANRVAVRPNSPLRDYRKAKPAEQTAEQTQPSTKLSQAPVHEDVMAALAEPEPEPRQSPGVANWQKPEETAAPAPTPQAVQPRPQPLAPRVAPAQQLLQTFAHDPVIARAAVKALSKFPPEARQQAAENFIEAYHGSPHDFDQFSRSKVRTGEGHATYGEGHYLAENPAVADKYSKSVTKKDFIDKVRELYDQHDSPDDARAAITESKEFTPGQKRLLAALEKDDYFGFDYPHQAVQEALSSKFSLDKWPDTSPETMKAIAEVGNIYKVNIKANKDHFLDWDKPLSGQTEHVKATLEKAIGPRPENMTGAEIYRSLSTSEKGKGGASTSAGMKLNDFHDYSNKGTPETASNMLRDAGIPGIRYLDRGSRAEGEGSRNYVVFSDEPIKIIEKNGKPVEQKPPEDDLDIPSFLRRPKTAAPVEQPKVPASKTTEPAPAAGEPKVTAAQRANHPIGWTDQQIQQAIASKAEERRLQSNKRIATMKAKMENAPAENVSAKNASAEMPLTGKAALAKIREAAEIAKRTTKNAKGEIESAPTDSDSALKKLWDNAGKLAKDDDGSFVIPEEHLKTFRRLLGDEEGAIAPRKMLEWMKTRVTDYWDPKALPAVQEYGNQLGERFIKLRNFIAGFRGDLLKNVVEADKKLTLEEAMRLDRAILERKVDTLPQKFQDYYKDHLEEPIKLYGEMFDELKAIKTELKIPGYDKMVDRSDSGITAFWPRLKKSHQVNDEEIHDVLGTQQENSKPWSPRRGNSLSTEASTTKPRDWFTAQNAYGKRVVFIPGDGKITMMQNGKPITIKTPEGFDARQIGNKFEWTPKGHQSNEPMMWEVDNARPDEIKKAAGKNDDGTWREEYHEHPLLTITNALDGLNAALLKAKTYESLIRNPLFAENRSLKKPEAHPDWVQPRRGAPFDDYYMPEAIAHVLEDFHKPGIGAEGKVINSVRWAANAGVKVFYTLGFPVHILNELDKWGTGRGYKWIPGTGGYKDLATTVGPALKSVWKQDDIQREIRNAGGNPMYLHTLTTRLIPQVANKLGVDMKRNVWRWDPLARMFNMSVPELGHFLFDRSNRAMWMATDVFYTQRYLEAKRNGMTPKRAIEEVEKYVDTYNVPTRMLGSRDARKFLTERAIAQFTGYHVGIFKTYNSMMKDLVQRTKTTQERTMAGSQIAMHALMTTLFWSVAINYLYHLIPGTDERDEVERRGVSKVTNAMYKTAFGHGNYTDNLRDIFMPSVPLNYSIDFTKNKDFTGKTIREPGASFMENNAHSLEHLASAFASPVRPLSRSIAEGNTAGETFKRVVEPNIGVKRYTPQGFLYKQEEEYRQALAAYNRRSKKTGVIPELYNAVVGH